MPQGLYPALTAASQAAARHDSARPRSKMRMMDNPAIEVRGLCVRGRRGTILAEIGITVDRGEIVSVFGPLGSGKSHLLQAIAGKVTPSSGDIRILGSPPGRGHREVDLVPDSKPITRRGSVQQWVSRHAATTGVPLSQRTGRVTRSLEALDLFALRDAPLSELSDGQRRSASLAAAFSSAAPVLLIDGLLDSLPAPLFARAWESLRNRATREDAAVIFCTVRSDIAEMADRALILDSGRKLAFAPPAELLDDCVQDTLTVEAVDASLVQGTLRGIFDIEIDETPGGVRFSAADGAVAAAHLFRHPPEGARAVYVRRSTLWDVLKRLREDTSRTREPNSTVPERDNTTKTISS